MIFKIEGRSVVKLEHKPGEKSSTHLTTDFNLDVSENVDRSTFLDKDEMPTAAGSKAITQCFVQGLIGNIHYAHQKGMRNDAEHLRYIISELERGFVTNANVYESHFDK